MFVEKSSALNFTHLLFCSSTVWGFVLIIPRWILLFACSDRIFKLLWEIPTPAWMWSSMSMNMFGDTDTLVLSDGWLNV